MSEIFLISLLSEFDINFKNFRITIKNQINRNYEHFYWIICLIVLSLHLLQTFNLLLISDDDEENLKIAGSIDFYVGSKGTRFMLDLCTITHYSLNLILLSNYLSDKMQWLLKMSSIYEEIRTKYFDTFLMNTAKRLSFYFKLGSILAIISGDLVIVSVLITKRDQLIDYPIGFTLFSLCMIIAIKVGYTLMFRQMVIIIFFCRMHCFLFKSCNKYFTQMSKKHLKTCLSFHYKLCESVEELQNFLRPMFVSITTMWCPIICYLIYYSVKDKEVENNFRIILVDIIMHIFLIFIIAFASMIAKIDVESKKGIHSVCKWGLKISNKQAIFHLIFILTKYCSVL